MKAEALEAVLVIILRSVIINLIVKNSGGKEGASKHVKEKWMGLL